MSEPLLLATEQELFDYLERGIVAGSLIDAIIRRTLADRFTRQIARQRLRKERRHWNRR